VITRVALVVVAMVVLGLMGGPPRQHHRCSVVDSILVVCNADAAPSPVVERGRRFARRLLTRWNNVEGRMGYPALRAACVPDGEAVYMCEFLVYDKADGYRCRRDFLSNTFLELSGAWVACKGPFTPPAAPGAA
jgi:hypothetical protein